MNSLPPEDTEFGLANKAGLTPLMFACVDDQPAMVEKLCQVPGINLNYRDIKGFTALMCAVATNHVQCVEKFRAINGVDWDALKHGLSAIMVAVKWGHVGVVEALLPVSSLNLNIKTSAGFSVAHYAVASDKVNSLRILELLCQDERVDWNTEDPMGKRPVLLPPQC